MCKIKDSIKPWKDTILMCKNMRDKLGIENFIFLRSKSDDKAKARKETIEKEMEIQGFDASLLFDVSAKNGDGIDEVKELLHSSNFWKNSKISTENKIKTQLISATGKARATDNKMIDLEHLKLPGFEDINENILDSFVKKLADEDAIYYIPSKKQILLDTEDMGLVESFMLNLFSEGEGLYRKDELIVPIKAEFDSLDQEEIIYYYEQFINYLIDSDKLTEFLPDLYVIKDRLKDKLLVPKNLLCTEIIIDEPIQILEVINTLNKISLLKLEEISKNQLKFKESMGNGEIYIEFPELIDFDEYKNCIHLKIYFKISELINDTFKLLYEQLRTHKLKDLPKILNFIKISEDSLENCVNLFNYPDEAPVLDFKREISYKTGKKGRVTKIQKEIIKDITALGNSSYNYGNSAYYIIGIEEKDGQFKGIMNVENQDILFQQIAFLCREYIQIGFNLSHLRLNVYELYKLVQEGKILTNIPFTTSQKDSKCDDVIMIVHITRNPKSCLELRKDLSWTSPKGIRKLKKGKSWIRLGSHSFDILNEERNRLFLK